MLRYLYRTLAWLAVAVLLWLPVHAAVLETGDWLDRWLVAGSVLALVLFLAGAVYATGARTARFWLPAIVVVLVFIHTLHYGLVQFSGSGYTQDFFVHLEGPSVALAWKEYGDLAMAVFGIAVPVLAGGWWLLRRERNTGRLPGLAILLAGAAGLVLTHPLMPAWQAWSAWSEWSRPVASELDPGQIQRWQASGLVNTDLTPKHDLVAEVPEQPRNLVLVYLESVGSGLLDHPEWPGLMPELSRLQQRHGWVDYLHASGFITIEGIANSLCGTLMPFRKGNDSLAAGEDLVDRLPCMTDVLDEAGYRQVYMGGAGLDFAGKGRLLEIHGYDRLMGIDYWREQGLNQRPGTWGLSDADLFEQALGQWSALKQNGVPFNLTLLTIGTHLPGYQYAECEPYPAGDDPFLHALHCTDQLLSRFVEQARQRDLMDDTLLVITADHNIFPNPDMKRLFGDTVYDRRLPMIVIGDDLPEPGTARGAGYDLAPTVLDLLGVRHNAGFLLGRSLVRADGERASFFSRYVDIHAGRQVSYDRECIADGDVPTPPLDRCQKEDFLEFLYSYADALSDRRTRLTCGWLDRDTLMRLPEGERAAMGFTVAGADQMKRFTYKSRPVRAGARGLYIAELDDQGVFRDRRYWPHDRPDAWPDINGAGIRWVAWWPPGGGAPVPVDALDALPGWRPDEPGLWLLDDGELVKRGVSHSGQGGLVLELDTDTCRRLVTAGPAQAAGHSG